MTLGGLETRCTVSFDSNLKADQLFIQGENKAGHALERVSAFLNRIRSMAENSTFARIESESNFPEGTGIASSASAFAAMTVAALEVVGIEMDTERISRIARLGSGSACRSVLGGYVEMYTGKTDKEAYAYQFAPADHWNLEDIIVILRTEPKSVGSSQGHRLAETSPLQTARVMDTPRRISLCKKALLARDFVAFAEIVECDSNLMHAVMMTSNPPLFYWEPATLAIMKLIPHLRNRGLSVCYTIDAGPNVHCICTSDVADEVEAELRDLPEVISLLRAVPGEPAQIL
jgi:diphosphomevalonate decarboxylase